MKATLPASNFSAADPIATLEHPFPDPALVAATTVAMAGLVGVVLSVFLATRITRRSLMTVSAAGTAGTFAMLAVPYFTDYGEF